MPKSTTKLNYVFILQLFVGVTSIILGDWFGIYLGIKYIEISASIMFLLPYVLINLLLIAFFLLFKWQKQLKSDLLALNISTISSAILTWIFVFYTSKSTSYDGEEGLVYILLIPMLTIVGYIASKARIDNKING